MIDFDNIDREILENPKENQVALIAEQAILNIEIDLAPFIEEAQRFEVVSKSSANACLSMSLQARKMRQSLDKSRSEILKPHQNFIRAINKQAKDYEIKLDEIEKELSNKILVWLENPEESETIKMNVEDGYLTKKSKKYFDLVNINLVPMEYLKLDEKKVEEAIKNGTEHILGINIYTRSEIDLRVKNS